MSSGTVYTNRISHSRFYISWSQAGEKSKTINYSVGIETKDETGYWDDWYYNAITISNCNIGGKNVISNGVYSNVSNGRTAELANGSVTVENSTFEISIDASLYNTGSVSKSERITIDIEPPKPSVNISVSAKTATSMTIKANVNNGVSASKYTFVCGNTTKEVSSNTHKFIDLIPGTKYTIKARGYGNGGWGSYASTSATTSKQATITNAELTTNGGKIDISNNSGEDCNLVILIDNNEIARRNKVENGTYNLIFSDEEQKNIYKLMGLNNSINCIVRLENANRNKDYEKEIIIANDAFSCSIFVNGAVKKGRLWIGTSKGNKRGIFVVGTKYGNRRGK